MIACLQRVKSAKVEVENSVVGAIDKGMLIFLGVEKGDNDDVLKWVSNKSLNLRMFEDELGKMSLSLKDIGGKVLIISQFTLAADCSKGKRPDFTNAEEPKKAEALYVRFIDEAVKLFGNDNVASGKFRADMVVSLVNEGPVTFIVEKRNNEIEDL